MYRIRRSKDRGHFNHGWLNTYHTFSFGQYMDPANVQFRSLRVMNEDWVAAGQGFGMHGHKNMEIVTYVLEGALEHKDSLGTGEVLRPGELQRMTAGSGIRHSEFNPSASEATHLYQIWLFPEKEDLDPSYEQRPLEPAKRQNAWQVVASPNRENDSLLIHTDARLLLANLTDGHQLSHDIQPGRHAWLQVLRGGVSLAEHQLQAGDGVAISNETSLAIAAQPTAEVLLFDLA